MHSLDNSTISEFIDQELTAFREMKNSQGAMQVWQWSGVLEAVNVHAITQDLEEHLSQVGASKQCLKRTFSILIEGLQNTLVHSVKVNERPLFGLGVAYLNNQVDMVIYSLADDKHVSKVSQLVNDLNKMSAEDLKEHYRMTMNNGKISEKGGAGLGLITMIMRSKDGIHLGTSALTPQWSVLSSSLSVV